MPTCAPAFLNGLIDFFPLTMAIAGALGGHGTTEQREYPLDRVRDYADGTRDTVPPFRQDLHR
ncbi:MAG: hypothetical protein U0703_08770 [Anaerolineae bacterium]